LPIVDLIRARPVNSLTFDGRHLRLVKSVEGRRQLVGPARREREVIADFQLEIVDLIRAARSLTLCRRVCVDSKMSSDEF
jgi:hypothetical protein